jgi:hypothetical protein
MRRAFAFCFAAWSDITRRHVATTLVLGVAALVALLVIAPDSITKLVVHPNVAAGALFGLELRVFALLLAIVVADRAVPAGSRHPAAYALAAVIGCCIGMGLDALARQIFWGTFFPFDKLYPDESPQPATMPLYLLFDWLLLGGVATFLYADRRRSLATAHNLRAAEIARVARRSACSNPVCKRCRRASNRRFCSTPWRRSGDCTRWMRPRAA